MLNSVPVFLQAATWPLIGAAIILALGRLMPGWLRRAVAAGSALASLISLWRLATGHELFIRSTTLAWEPTNFFRMGLDFWPHSLSLLAGLVLAGFTAAIALALSPRDSRQWHGLVLLALSGCLVMAMAANLLALTVGSGLLAMAVIALAPWSGRPDDKNAWPPLAVAMPGIVATLLLFLATLEMDVEVGHASLLAKTIPERELILAGGAGLLWVLTFVVKVVDRVENAAALLLPCGAGLYLLARVQAQSPVLADARWLPAAGLLLLAGGSLLAWLRGAWPGLAVQQLGLAVTYIWLNGGALPWPLAALLPALGLLALDVNGNGAQATQPAPAAGRTLSWQIPPGRLTGWLAERIEPWWARLRAALERWAARLDRWRGSWLGQRRAAIWPAIALASVIGLPLTAGGVSRWLFYGAILYRGLGPVLVLALAGDILVTAAAVIEVRTALAGAARPRPVAAGATIGRIGLAVIIVVWGIAPGALARAVGLPPAERPDVSPWGLGLLVVLPWLIGAWLALSGRRVADRMEAVRRAFHADWLFRGAGWLGGRLSGGLYWLGQVGEGEGWWGWALILLALGALFWMSR